MGQTELTATHSAANSGSHGAEAAQAADVATAEIAEHYGEVARNAQAATQTASSASGAAACECCESDTAQAGEAFALYSQEVLAGLPVGALAASRGCGDPVARASLAPGERVLDLGSGGGIDALIAARLVGAQGHVFGLDMTPDMIALARKNADEARIDNVEFIEGSIDDIPLPNSCVDVVISNCVVNLCENKSAVFAEAKRVLVPGGRLVVSDIVAFRPIPEGAAKALATITGCRRGITPQASYRAMLADCGFSEVDIEPKTIYTIDRLKEKALRKNRGAALDIILGFDVDGVCGSAIVYGRAE